MERKTLSFDSGTLIVGVDLHLGQLVQAIEERGVPENGLPFDEHYQLCIKTPEFINSEPEGFSIWTVGRGIIAAFIWSPYFLISKRVKRTLTK